MGVYSWPSEEGRVVDEVLYRGRALFSQTMELMGTLPTPYLLGNSTVRHKQFKKFPECMSSYFVL